MNTIETKAIVLGSIKYNDTYKIMYLYSYDFGKLSVLWRYNKTKRNNFPPPFTEIELVLKNAKNNLYKLKDFSFINHSQNIYIDHTKTNITIFLCEIIMKVITFAEKDETLYSFLSKIIYELNDINNGKENFHIYFLIKFTNYIGINPSIDISNGKNVFSLNDGCFTPSSNMGLSESDSLFLIKLFRINIRNIHLFKLNRKNRNIILDYILIYYKIHISGFSEIKSLEILRSEYDCYAVNI